MHSCFYIALVQLILQGIKCDEPLAAMGVHGESLMLTVVGATVTTLFGMIISGAMYSHMKANGSHLDYEKMGGRKRNRDFRKIGGGRHVGRNRERERRLRILYV
ncbi:hypothetical protein SNEBB_006200 [Seison nebaliae]|nr:hypothetical protein SNEBB_006200 [Seison nebaliae]